MDTASNLQHESAGPVSIDGALASLTFLADRTPLTRSDDYFGILSAYRDGAIFVAHYAGTSEWERHRAGDEIVLVLDGATTIILRIDGVEERHLLRAHELIVVPRAVWHRFETPTEVKVLSVTPQPTDHTAIDPERP